MRMQAAKYTLLLMMLGLPWAFGQALAQPLTGRLNFTHYTVKQGLSNSNVRCLAQDQQGFIWVGTANGLNRFDGLEFKWYRNDPRNPAALVGHTVNTIVPNGPESLLVGTSSGLNILDLRTETFRFMPVSAELTGVTDIVQDTAGGYWLSTEGEGVFYSGDSLKTLEARPMAGSGYIFDLQPTSAGHIWAGTQQGLFAVEPFGQEIPVPEALQLSAPVWKILEDGKGMLWVGTEGQGLYKYNPFTGNVAHYEHNPAYPHLADNRIHDLIEDHEGNIWIATSGGLTILDPRAGVFDSYRPGPHPQSLNSYSVRKVFEDQQGNFWLGTYNNGLNVQLNNRNAFNSITHGIGHIPQGPPVLHVAEDQKGRVWMGTGGQGICLMDRSGARINLSPHSTPALPLTTVYCTYESPAGYYWLGAYRQGLTLYSEQKGVLATYRHKPGDTTSLSHDNVRAIMEDSYGNFWVLTNGGGLNLFDQTKGTFSHFRHNPAQPASSLASDYGILLYEDSRGRLWIGTYRGLSCMNPTAGQITSYMHQPNDSTSLSANWVYAVYEDQAKRLWVGTVNGLNYLDETTGQFAHMYTADGLPDNVINGMAEDSDGRLWLSTNMGLARLHDIEVQHGRVKATVQAFDISDDLQGNEYSTNAFLKTRDGRFVIGGLNGVNYFDPDDIRGNAFVPPVLITGIKVNNKPMQVFGQRFWRCAEQGMGSLALPFALNNVAFDYVALNFVVPQKNEYAYKLEGFDEGWVSAGHERRAVYTGLQPGKYVFRVKGANNHGVWNQVGAGMVVRILPPWYLSAWAWALYAVLLLMGVVFFVHYIYMLKQYPLKWPRVGKRLPPQPQSRKAGTALPVAEVEATPPSLEKEDRYFLAKVDGLIEDNLDNVHFQVQVIEKAIGLSRPLLIKRLKTLTGKTVVEYVRDYRLERAAELLQQPEHSVSEVAYMVGFNDPKYFSKLFKNRFKQSPSVFKE